MFKRAKYQKGCLIRERRKRSSDVWVFRYRDGNGVNRKIQVGDVIRYPTKASAQKACERFRVNINGATYSAKTMSELIEHYRQHELVACSRKAYSTCQCYESYLTLWIEPVWGEKAVWEVKTVQVEAWLDRLTLANGTKAKIRNILSALFRHAMRNEWIDRNPISLVRQSAKRRDLPDVLTPDELRALLSELPEPYRTMVAAASLTGLRVSELLALKWQDVDWRKMELKANRGIVHQVVGELKTECSAKPLPLDSGLAELLLDWRSQTRYAKDTDWVFASPAKRGTQPYWPDTVRARVIQPAAKRAGITKRIGWHTFRRTYGTLLKCFGEDVKVVQELMRHSNSRLTLDTYVQAITAQKRQAVGNVSRTLLGEAVQ